MEAICEAIHPPHRTVFVTHILSILIFAIRMCSESACQSPQSLPLLFWAIVIAIVIVIVMHTPDI